MRHGKTEQESLKKDGSATFTVRSSIPLK